MTDELVFVVPRASIADEAGWYGIRTDDLDAFLEALERDGRYEARTAMEVDPSFKQVIPYLVLRDGERFFLMRRTKGGVDARLHDRYSIGVGGHVNPEDADVVRMAGETGFAVQKIEDAVSRQEKNADVPGLLVVLSTAR